jgi:hypothetical protein
MDVELTSAHRDHKTSLVVQGTTPMVLFPVHGAFFPKFVLLGKGSPDVAVKLLPCDHEVMGSSPGNNLLQKGRERLHT